MTGALATFGDPRDREGRPAPPANYQAEQVLLSDFPLDRLATLTPGLLAEWMSLPTLTKKQTHSLAAAGVSWEAIQRAGGLAWARVAVTGRLFTPDTSGPVALIQGVWDGLAPSIFAINDTPPQDLIAWTCEAPDDWVYREGGRNLVLGDDQLLAAHRDDTPVRLHRSPLGWLRAGCNGAVLLEWCEWQWGLGKDIGEFGV